MAKKKDPVQFMEGRYTNYRAAMYVLSLEHGDEARDILEKGLADGSIELGMPGKEYGFCFSMDGLTWFQDTSSVPD